MTFLALLTFLTLSSQAQEIRVLLDYIEAKELNIEMPKNGSLTLTQEGANAGKMKASGSVKIADGLVMRSEKGHQLQWRGKPYRGRLEVRAAESGRLALVNVLNLEDYLYGVLPSEVDTKTWPMETLKAQAVVSRSYAYRMIEEGKNAAYHVGTTARHQVYFGATFEDTRAREAVDMTHGEVLVNKQGNILSAYFHSCCGGRTEDARFVWSADAPEELVGVSDLGYCKNSPYYSWVTTLPESEMTTALRKLGHTVNSPVKQVFVGSFSRSMRALTMKVVAGRERFDLKTSSLRTALGANWIRSTKITGIKNKGGKFLISGLGWGHGIGLCQWGAKGMADKGNNYVRILKHYFPKATMITRE